MIDKLFTPGLFDVHNAGSTPYTCGGINDQHGLPLLEAFNFALDFVNNKTGMFRYVDYKEKLNNIIITHLHVMTFIN